MHRRNNPGRPTTGDLRAAAARAALVVALGVLAACGSGGDSDDADPSPASADAPSATDGSSDGDGSDEGGSDGGGADDGGGSVDDESTTDSDDPIAAAPTLAPTTTFPIERPDDVSSVAMAPDGSQIAVVTQVGLGDPVTITMYDSATGDVVNSTEVEAIGLSNVQWMADGRLVAFADREADPVWRSWDSATLDELPTVALDFGCYIGRADRNTGVVYASDGLISMGVDLCRVDTADGSVTRTADGVLVEPQTFWLVPNSGGVAVQHYPDPNGGPELVILDPDTLAAVSSTPLGQGDGVEAVGLTTWISPFDGPSRLEPGAIAVPPRSSPEPSDAGTVFVSSNGGDDVMFISATDGSVIGTMSAEWNPSFTSDWSIDDSSYVRITLDGQAEIYEF